MAKVEIEAKHRNFYNGHTYEKDERGKIDKGYFERIGHRWARLVKEETEPEEKESKPKKKKKYENKESVSGKE